MTRDEAIAALERAIESHRRLRLAEWMTEGQALSDVEKLSALADALRECRVQFDPLAYEDRERDVWIIPEPKVQP